MLNSIGRRTGRLLRRFGKSPSGATAVEFALVAFPFFYVLGCVCETGLMLFTEYVIQNSVQDASRNIRTGQVTDSAGTLKVTAADFKTSLCANVSTLIDCAGKVTVYVNSAANFATLKANMADPLSIGQKSDGTWSATVFSPGGAKVAAGVVATYDWSFAFPFMNFLGNVMSNTKRRLYGIAIFRNEPF
jgi:Flp pilus assembly protein TadG